MGINDKGIKTMRDIYSFARMLLRCLPVLLFILLDTLAQYAAPLTDTLTWKNIASRYKNFVEVRPIGSVAKNILATFHSGNEQVFTATSCMISEFLQQSPYRRRERSRQDFHVKYFVNTVSLPVPAPRGSIRWDNM